MPKTLDIVFNVKPTVIIMGDKPLEITPLMNTISQETSITSGTGLQVTSDSQKVLCSIGLKNGGF